MTLIVVLTKADDNIRCRYFDEMILIVGLGIAALEAFTVR